LKVIFAFKNAAFLDLTFALCLISFMLPIAYLVVQTIVLVLLSVVCTLMVLRLIFSYADPNPFGALGKAAFKLRKATEAYVFPAERFLMRFRIDIKFAPLLVILLVCFAAYVGLQIIGNAFFVADGLVAGITSGNFKAAAGYFFYGLISLYILFIYIRFIASWFVCTRNTFLGFVRRVTDPLVIPVQKLIPPIGMIDISLLILLLALGFAQSLILKIFVLS
jgi:YggT family protein